MNKTSHIYYSANNLPEGWDAFVKHDIFLQASYLKALEEASPNNIQLFYVGVFNDGLLVGVAIIQRVQLYLKDMFRKTEVSCLKEFFQNIISKILKGNILVVGNLTHTGQHALFFDENKITQSDFFNVIFEGLDTLRLKIKETQGKKIRALMLKDFFLEDPIHKDKTTFNAHKLHEVFVQPNMIMSTSSNWVKIEDYKADLNKKYRDRYKRAKKKLGAIKCIELDLESIKTNSKKLHNLYLNVSNNAKFNTFILPEKHFCILKQNLKEHFKVFGYYLDDTLVGFYTLILNGKNLETYFLGYDKELQHSNQLYLNMLYDMVKFGIENKFSSVVYARTAMEIKSSIGAKPKAMLVYLKHTNRFMNTILKGVFGLMNPTKDWEERHPFKN
ncbi:GNAT family N-acetyltransferase [Flavivirga abyssicola]|uniref:GNAT family N-acetyltransferase n=1 Tax=Flavivirga abyssicola TaxID=3063533 RepID=UPI0026E0C2B5|nr:GNAT family N-acetyltransferase [Flavivirga sp. MEBiC07777]WVK14843.1 GNAT family N-acetyltransferase [Flavivirga sp. MEBiC07777]